MTLRYNKIEFKIGAWPVDTLIESIPFPLPGERHFLTLGNNFNTMAEPATRPTDQSVADYIDSIADETRRKDAQTVDAMMKSITKKKPVMWGNAIIGYGSKQLVYASGKKLDWPILAFSPRKAATTLYLTQRFKEFKPLFKQLGKAKMSGSCLHIKSLADVDMPTLKKLVTTSYKVMAKK